MNYWLQRISAGMEATHPLLQDRNILTIGFGYIAGGLMVDDIQKEDGQRALEEYYDKEQGGWHPRNRFCLLRFIREFKTGDKVVVPTWDVFSVYEITSENVKPIADIQSDVQTGDLKDWHGNALEIKENRRLWRGGEVIDTAFYWKVKPVATNMPRKDYADAALTSKMKWRGINLNISDISESIEKAIDSFKNNKPIKLYSNVMDNVVPQVLESITTSLNPDKFEKLVKFYFERVGATHVDINTGNSREKDGDVDVRAVFEPIKTIIYVQVKFHKPESQTNEWAVEQINDYKNNNDMDDGYSGITWVVTAADNYTPKCIRMAQEAGVILINGTEFSKMLIENVGLSELENFNK